MHDIYLGFNASTPVAAQGIAMENAVLAARRALSR